MCKYNIYIARSFQFPDAQIPPAKLINLSRISDKLSLHTNSSRVVAQQQQQHQQHQQQLPSPSLPSSPSSFVPSTPHSSTTRSSLTSSVPSHHPTNSWHGSAHRQKPSGGNQHVANIIKPLPNENDFVLDISRDTMPHQYQSLQALQQQQTSPQASANPISFKPAQPVIQIQNPQRTTGRYSLNDFIIHRTLGTGSFGRVHLGAYATHATRATYRFVANYYLLIYLLNHTIS